jgi:hypothetical protein
MKLNDIYSKSMKEVLEQDCDVVEQKIHTSDNGVVQAIEIKYRPKDYEEPKDISAGPVRRSRP